MTQPDSEPTPTSSVWKNRVMIFGAFQSLVFGAVGWLFGREINRTSAEDARADGELRPDPGAGEPPSAAAPRIAAQAAMAQALYGPR